MQALWGLQHCGHEWDSGLPEKAAGPPVTQVSPGEIEVVGDGFPRVLGTSTGTVTGSDRRRQWLSWGPRASRGGDGCPAPAYGLVKTSAATPYRPRPDRMAGTGALGHHGAHLQRTPWEATPQLRSTGCTCLRIVCASFFFFLVECTRFFLKMP